MLVPAANCLKRFLTSHQHNKAMGHFTEYYTTLEFHQDCGKLLYYNTEDLALVVCCIFLSLGFHSHLLKQSTWCGQFVPCQNVAWFVGWVIRMPCKPQTKGVCVVKRIATPLENNKLLNSLAHELHAVLNLDYHSSHVCLAKLQSMLLQNVFQVFSCYVTVNVNFGEI